MAGIFVHLFGWLVLATAAPPNNPFFSVFNDKDIKHNQTPNGASRLSVLPKGVLFFMQSVTDHTRPRPPGGEASKQQEVAKTESDVELPPGLSRLFPSVLLAETSSGPSKSNSKAVLVEGASPESLPFVLHRYSRREATGPPAADDETSTSDRGLPDLFADSRSDREKTSPERMKVRGNRRLRNHHRKMKQRQAGPSSVASGGRMTSYLNPDLSRITLKTDAVRRQRLNFLNSQRGPPRSEERRPQVALLSGVVLVSSSRGHMTPVQPEAKLARGGDRTRRAASMAGPEMGDTFSYRLPDAEGGGRGSTGATGGVGTGQGPGHREEAGRALHTVDLPPAETPKPDTDSAEQGKPAQPIKTGVPVNPDIGQAEESLPDNSGEKLGAGDPKSEETLNTPQAASATENATLNETLARQMYRSPMLVDYGSRVKAHDVVRPTEGDLAMHEEPEAEDQVLAEEVAMDEKTALTAEEDDDVSLGESSPELDQPPLPEAEVEPENESQAEAEPDTVELPLIPQTQSAGPDELPAAGHPEAEPGKSEPEGEYAEPEGEEESPTGGAEGEAENRGDGQPEGEAEGEGERAEPEGQTYAEPQPEWDEAKAVWGPWWEVHVYGIGLAFAILCAYSLVSILRLWRKKNLLSQGYFIALNCIMFSIGLFRAVYFLVDGYNSKGTFHPTGHYFLYSIGFPCLTSAFSILLMALLQTLKMQILSPKIQRTRVLVGIIAFHFILSIVTDVVVGYLYSAKVLMFVCQATTVLWGLLLFVSYIYVFRKLYKAAMWRQNEMLRLALAKFKLDGITPITKAPRLTLNMAVRITLGTAIFGLMLAALQTYGMFGVYSTFSDTVPNPWTWLAFNTGLRLTELAMCVTMSYVATQPFRYHQGSGAGGSSVTSSGGENPSSAAVGRSLGLGSWLSSCMYMAPCRRIFECDSASLHDDDLSWTDLPVHADRNEMDGGEGPVLSEEATPMTASGRASQAAAAAAAAGGGSGMGLLSPASTERETSIRRCNKVAARPASLLVSDNGFIRFREDGELGGSPVLLSTDDELENISGDNIGVRNPFYRDLLRRQEKERAVGRATFVSSEGISLQDEFGLAETLPDPELVPPPRPTYPIKSYRGCSYPTTGTNTPGTPRSFCSTDLEYAASEMSYRPPSSIHLRDSIENALNIPGFTLRTPDLLDSPLNMAHLRAHHTNLLGRGGCRPAGTGSMSDLESLRHYGPGSKYGNSEDTVEYQQQADRAASPDSMYSYTLSNLTRAPLVRSYSDSIGKASKPEDSQPNSPERRYYKDRLRASMLRGSHQAHPHAESSHQFQNLLKNINEMCNQYNKLSPDDREADE